MILIVISAYAQDNRKQYLSDISEKFKDSLDYSGVFLVSNDSTILLQKAYGYSNIEHKVKNTIDTKFRIASISKMFVSYAIFILADQNKIDFDESIEKYFPSLKKELSKEITIKHLLGHSSGLIRDIDRLSSKSYHENYTEKEFITLLNSTNLQSIPGRSYSYSNVGYSLLGRIIERVTKKEYNDAMNYLIFQPLNLKNTGHEIEGQIIPNIASGYNSLGEELFKSSHENKSHVFASGSMYSTAHDLLLFAKEIFKGSLISSKTHEIYLGTNKEDSKISSGWVSWTYTSNLSKQKVNDQVLTIDNSALYYKKSKNQVLKLGANSLSCPGGNSTGKVLWHGGSCPGFRVTMNLYLEDNIVVIGLSNKVPINIPLIYNKLGNIALGLEPEKLFKPHLTKFTKDIIQGNFKTAIQKYERLLKENPNNEELKAGELNTLGYMYLEYSKTKEAINVFKFATILFPKNANAFDSLGEALLSDGNESEAIEMYKKSLKLNSRNENAKAIIKQLKNI